MKLSGTVQLPGDKSISHRAIMFNAISFGKARLTHVLKSEDIKATITILRLCGVKIDENDEEIIVYGGGFNGIHSNKSLDCMNSGTSARLFLGLLSGLNETFSLFGDASLSKRPMYRVVKHLEKFNGKIELHQGNYLPAHILPSQLKAAEIFLDVSSAQVKSAVILAALKAKEKTVIHELSHSRNHTELMLSYLGADIKVDGLTITVSGKEPLQARDMDIPGDISSAAFFIVAALITPNSSIVIKNCGLNPTRTGILSILDQIEANYEIKNKREVFNEPVGEIMISYQEELKPFTINKNLVPLLIDEIPVLALLATQIKGTSSIKDASELRVKESDRIKVTTQVLNALGANITECPDGMVIKGKTNLHKNQVDTEHDHRISMMLKVAKLICPEIKIIHDDCDKISYPEFETDLMKLIK